MRTTILDGGLLARALGCARDSLAGISQTAVTILLAAALAFSSLHGALHISMRLVQTSDSAQSFVAGHAIAHGNVLLSGWNVPLDDYYLTDTLPYATLDWLLGPRPFFLALVPALTYAAFVLLTYLLFSPRARGTQQAVENCAAAALMVALPAWIGDWNPLLMSDMHFATVAGSLVALALCCRAVETPGLGLALALIGVTGAIVASDPFSLVFAFAPALALLGLDALRGRERAGIALLVLSAGVLLGLALPPLIALAGGFTTEDITVAGLAGWPLVARNLTVVLAGFTSLFGANPFSGSGSPLLAVRAIALVVAVSAVAETVLRLFAPDRAHLFDRLLCAGILCVLAACAFSGQFGKGITPDAFRTGGPPMRYVMPAAVFAAVVGARRLPSWLAALAHARARVAARVALLSCAVLLIVGDWTATEGPASPWIRNSPAQAVGDWLANRGLTSGVGEYWSANVVAAMSANAVQIGSVAVQDNRLAPYVLAADTNWFASSPDFVLWRDRNPTGVTFDEVHATYDVCRTVVVAGYRVAILRRAAHQAGCTLRPEEDQKKANGGGE
jgi:hypothetical protein